VMKVPVEVGGEEHRAAFYFICFLWFYLFFVGFKCETLGDSELLSRFCAVFW
jgi:hypothetical protein